MPDSLIGFGLFRGYSDSVNFFLEQQDVSATVTVEHTVCRGARSHLMANSTEKATRFARAAVGR